MTTLTTSGLSRPTGAGGEKETRSMTTACLFPGQGSQLVGMGKGLFARFPALTEQASDLLGYAIDTLCLEDPDKRLNLTQFTQPALYVTCALTYLALREDEMPEPAWAAGHSLGEYGALFAAGSFDFATGLALVRERGRLMGEVSGTSMAAVLGLDAGRLVDLLGSDPRFDRLDVANFNARAQTVVSGDIDQLKRLEAVIGDMGGRFFPLKVSAAFHSRFMRDAQARFAAIADTVAFQPPRFPVIANLTAAPYPPDRAGIRDTLVGQLASPVRWFDTIARLLAEPVQHFREVGPGNVLSRLTETIRAELAAAPRTEQVTAPSAVAAPPRPTAPREAGIILCPGTGGQYYNMGRRAYAEDPAYRTAFHACDALAQPLIGQSLRSIVHDAPDPAAPFTRTLHAHLAGFAFSYAMVQSLRARGTAPVAYVGFSLGEYVALAATGALSLDTAIALVALQAQLVEERTAPAEMLSVLANVNIYYCLDELFRGCALAGIHTDDCFVVTGDTDAVDRLSAGLTARQITNHRLPVRHGFHSAHVDPVETPFLARCAAVARNQPGMPFYSSVLRGAVTAVDDDYLWRICRSRFNFRTALLMAVEAFPEAILLDVGPSGTSAAHARAILANTREVRHALRPN